MQRRTQLHKQTNKCISSSSHKKLWRNITNTIPTQPIPMLRTWIIRAWKALKPNAHPKLTLHHGHRPPLPTEQLFDVYTTQRTQSNQVTQWNAKLGAKWEDIHRAVHCGWQCHRRRNSKCSGARESRYTLLSALIPQQPNKKKQMIDREIDHKIGELGLGQRIKRTRKRKRPLGKPETLRTPPWSTILVARSKFFPYRKCKLEKFQ